jgi:hypothetical protein
MSTLERRVRYEAGQSLVLMVLILAFVLVPVTALVIDGGNAVGHQRAVQNGSDSSALAGAVQMRRYIACHRADGADLPNPCPTPAGGWDQSIWNAIQGAATTNGVEVALAVYTDFDGDPLGPSGQPANVGGAARVGAGQVPRTATGVLVFGHQDVPTLIAGYVGLDSWSIDTQATAIAGWTGRCDAAQGCRLLPVAFSVNTITCDANGNAVLGPDKWQYDTLYVIPLCSNSAGNIGWIDWSPKNGGASELAGAIKYLSSGFVQVPSWEYVTMPGNTNSSKVEDAMSAYDGAIVATPHFDAICLADPDNGQVSSPPSYGCPNRGNNNGNGGGGNNIWYRMVSIDNFELCSPATTGCGGRHGAYVNGKDNSAICRTVSGSAATSCLIGFFRHISAVDWTNTGGTVSQSFGVQLIR